MNMQTATARSLALVAAATWLLQPVLCDLTHALEAHSHCFEEDHDDDHHQGLDLSGSTPSEIEEGHDCCGGHDRPDGVIVVTSSAIDALGLTGHHFALVSYF